MPEGCRRRCPNVINIFRTWGVEKDSLFSLLLSSPLAPPFSHPLRLILFSPGPNFLADAPSAEGWPQIFNLHFSSPIPVASIPLTPSPSSFPPFLFPFPHKGPRLNSQRPHWEESVNATGKRERENIESLRGVSRDSSRRAFLLSRRNSNFVRIYMGKIWKRGFVKGPEWIVYFDDDDVETWFRLS